MATKHAPLFISDKFHIPICFLILLGLLLLLPLLLPLLFLFLLDSGPERGECPVKHRGEIVFVLLSVCLSVCQSVCLLMLLSICMSAPVRLAQAAQRLGQFLLGSRPSRG